MRKNMKSGISMRKYMDFNKRNANLYNQVVLTSGNTGSEVEKLQRMLVSLAEEYTSIPVVNINSNYDELTKKAVTELQKVMGLNTTGNVNKIMWDRMCILSSNKMKNGNRVEDETNFDESENVLMYGSKGRMVVDLQKYLNTVSEKFKSIPKLVVDGIFGPKTKEAVLEFQKLFNLEQDGIVGQITWETLYNISLGKKPPTTYN